MGIKAPHPSPYHPKGPYEQWKTRVKSSQARSAHAGAGVDHVGSLRTFLASLPRLAVRLGLQAQSQANNSKPKALNPEINIF